MSERDPVEPPYLEEVSPGIHAHIQPDGSWFLNNSGFLVGSRGVTVVDQCGTGARARAFLDRITATTDRPVQTLVNTHHHADHTFGNFVMPVHTTIVAHRRAREEQLATGTLITAMFEGPDWSDIEVRPSFLCFDDRLTLFVDDLEVQLIHFGSPAHTTNDVVVWVPERRLLFTGDLVFNGGTPFALQGSVAGWLETIESLRGLGAETVVPGHGPTCGPEVFDEVAAYLRFVQDAARRGVEDDRTPLELARELDLGEYAGLTDPERIVGNLHRAYAEARGEPRGEPLFLPPIALEMRDYLGGPVVSKA
jgi:cyclase